jgi:putative transcription factor
MIKMQCDLCGTETSKTTRVEVEHVEMSVCSGCSKYGKRLPPKPKPKPVMSDDQKKKVFEKVVHQRELVQVLVEDYAKIIKDAREKIGFKQVELAKKLNERESVIQGIEQGRLEPSMEFARKLEKMLEIKLIQEHVEEHKQKFKASGSSKFTLGDFIKVRKR